MTNAEKYLKVSIKEFGNAIINTQGDIDGLYSLEKWLDTEIKPTLTEDERVILRNLQPEITLIGRNGANKLFIAIDSTNEFVDFYCYDHLFQFIKERRKIFY